HVPCCVDHGIAKLDVERGLETVPILSERCEVSAVQAGHHGDSRKHTQVSSRLEDAHARIKLVKLHRSTPRSQTRRQHRPLERSRAYRIPLPGAAEPFGCTSP